MKNYKTSTKAGKLELRKAQLQKKLRVLIGDAEALAQWIGSGEQEALRLTALNQLKATLDDITHEMCACQSLADQVFDREI